MPSFFILFFNAPSSAVLRPQTWYPQSSSSLNPAFLISSSMSISGIVTEGGFAHLFISSIIVLKINCIVTS